MKLRLMQKKYHAVRSGQTLAEIARVYGCPPSVLVSLNGLRQEVKAGQVLLLPQAEYNLYRVQGGESKRILCGSKEEFEEKNGTSAFYPEQLVWI